MKKTLAAVAVLGAFAGSALAADVTLYGRVDMGLNYQHVDSDLPDSEATDNWKLESGNYTGSRFGVKGSDEIAEGVVVGFQLENGFDADTGKFGDDERFFNRESRLYVKTDFGELAAGRMGILNSDSGTYGQWSKVGTMASSWGSFTGGNDVVFAKQDTRLDNMITYKSPTFAGVTVLAQYGMGDDGAENTSKTNRYAAVGVTGQWDALGAALIVDSTNYKSFDADKGHLGDIDDSLTVTGGVSYDFGVAKTYFGAQYFKDVQGGVKDLGGVVAAALEANGQTADDLVMSEGYGLKVSVAAPVAGGTLEGMVGYLDAEEAAYDKDSMSRYTFAVGYSYPLSKRTKLYTAASYTQDKYEIKGMDDVKPTYVEVMAGMAHYF